MRSRHPLPSEDGHIGSSVRASPPRLRVYPAAPPHARAYRPWVLRSGPVWGRRDLDIVFAVQAPAETTAGTNHMECDIGVLNARRYGSIKLLWNLAWRPDFELPVLVMS